MRLSRLIAFLALAAAPTTVLAQAPVVSYAPDSPVASAAGPRVDAARLGVAPAAVEADAAGAAFAEPRLGQSVALMVVGGAALVAGLIIGGDAGTVVALGGAVIGLVGLYHYLR